ncbi:MAG TPA: lysylphosphatidylglycerol synthase transmembrane domain-containing protein [Candidatus Saccharibacteria bacterium]|nr:lysylphosphatidylglycerol synthase transmembrane domain-containing protein [Candidatus Saccharibacteria bacterium]
MKFRTWLSIITFVLLAVVIIAAWGDIREAFGYLGKVDLWILALIIPVQFISYFATGEMIFSYLRAKGNIRDLNVLKVTRMSLELNFVNHVFPSGGAAGIAYFSWLLGRHGVSSGRATMAQIIRFALTFASFVLLLLVALVILIIDHSVDRVTILLSLLLVVAAVGGMFGAIFLLGSKKRLDRFSMWLTRTVNKVVNWLTRGRKKKPLKEVTLATFFQDIHEDYLAIQREKKILFKPFLWALLANILDVVLIYIAFWSFGVQINPALIFIAFGLASIAGAVVVTPGGAGVYEVVMVAFLTSAGVEATTAIAGTLLARVVLMLLTIVFGYFFYQMTLVKYGKSPAQR